MVARGGRGRSNVPRNSNGNETGNVRLQRSCTCMQGHVREGCLRQGEREGERMGERGGKREGRERRRESGERQRECVRQTEGNGKRKMCGNAAQKGIWKRVRRVLQRELERGQKRKTERKAETV